MQLSDNEIVQMLQNSGSQNTGLKHMMLRYQEKLYWVIKNIVESHDDADDVLQNTFIKAYRNINSFESRSSLFTWLYRIATNEALSFKKASTRKATVSMPDWSNQMISIAAVENGHEEEAVIEKLQSALLSLPERQRQVFEMRYYQELSYDEISQLLHLTEGALKASYHHAVKKIEQYLIGANTH